MANMALMAWLPIMVESLLSGGDPTQLAAAKATRGHAGAGVPGPAPGGTGAAAVLLAAAPRPAAAAATALAGAAVQRTGRPLLYLAAFNWAGGAAFVSFRWAVRASRAAGFACLVATLACAYAAAPSAPVVVATLTAGPGGEAALAMPLFNSIAMLGGFLGPSAMGVLTQRLGGDFGAATSLLGCCMLVAGAGAAALERVMLRDPRTRAAVAARPPRGGAAAAGGGGGGYEMVPQKEDPVAGP